MAETNAQYADRMTALVLHQKPNLLWDWLLSLPAWLFAVIVLLSTLAGVFLCGVFMFAVFQVVRE